MDIKTGSYSSIAKDWKYLYDHCATTTVYQSPEVIGRVAKSLPYALRLRSKAYFLVVTNDGKPIMAYGYRNFDKKSVATIGTLENFDHSDLIFDSDCSDEQLNAALSCIRDYLKEKGKHCIVWDYIIAGSRTDKLIANAFGEKATPHYDYATLNVRINIGKGTYEEYFSSLSKQTRQNYRTSINRLRTDNCNFGSVEGGVNVYLSSSYSNKWNLSTIHKEYMKLYLSRLSEHYRSSRLQQLFRKYGHYISITCKSGPGFLCDVRINGKVAAIMRGYIDEKRKSIAVPCLAIDDINFQRYSPGIILIQKFIEYLRTNLPDIQYLDLERGTEGYKLKMGGEPYKMNCYKLEL